jgi:hypothetical protein
MDNQEQGLHVKGLLNWLATGVGVGITTFLTLALSDGIPDGVKLKAAGLAAAASMWNHLRQSPWGKKVE